MRISYLAFFLALLLSTPSFALMPPAYLSVPRWKNCVDTETIGSAQFVCLPKAKPRDCPYSSWRRLTGHNMLHRCQ